ncbi:tRNA (guanosine(46)-N7)-methyltransferase TrmB [Shouchella xiaoxiensis]|uniref:tRNA (guanosine(46)-N7)-methyltransferase TrmB n=1 Tax=Shouchella xiaoxiensis TaxID=766895 RepID=UPI00195D4EA1|nr:tRNA (guanosine(46)-N7)-methyltransferase TrmB [Shouchella xiaoxiensis]
MRLRHKPWAREELDKRPNLVIQNPASFQGKWKDVFEKNQPLHIEVGTGKGQFITNMAIQNPTINFIGVERYESVLLTAMEKAELAGLKNLKFLGQDVKNLNQFFAENEVDRLFINFTDPWPKSRHEKRRLTYKTFLAIYKQVLKKDGEIHFKTDNQGLFEYSLHSMSTFGLSLKNVSLDLHNSAIENNIMTEYEERFSEKGMRIYRLEATYPQ